MKKVELNIFGKLINIMPAASVVTALKLDNERVELTVTSQSGHLYTQPLDVKKELNKTADEFIKEFEKQCYFAYETEKNISGTTNIND